MDNDKIIITPASLYKDTINWANQNYPLEQVTIYQLDEFYQKYYFSYDLNAIAYLLKKGLNIDVANIYLQNLLFITDKEYTSPKLNALKEIKKELIVKNLLIFDPRFSLFLENKHVIFIAPDKEEGLFSYTIEKLKQKMDVTVYDKKYSEKKLTIYNATSMEEEVNFVFIKIIELFNQGIELSKIFLVGNLDNYIDTLEYYSKLYHLPINLKKNTPLMATSIGKTFYKNFILTRSLETAFSTVQGKNAEIDRELSSIANQLLEVEGFNEQCILLKKLLLTTNVSSLKFENAITMGSFFDKVYREDEYVFVMGLNNQEFPKLYKDEDYIQDSIKHETFLFTTEKKNQLIKESFAKRLYSIPNLTITSKKKSRFEEAYPSDLVKDLKMEEIDIDIRDYSHSHLLNQITLTSFLDTYQKYHEKSDDLEFLLKAYPRIPYQKYDYSYQKINIPSEEITLSYSAIDVFYHCPFRYYVSNVLKIREQENTFPLFIGNLFHHILSSAFLPSFDFDKAFEEELKTRTFTKTEETLLIRLKDKLKLDIEIINAQTKEMNFISSFYERPFKIVRNTSVGNYTLKGTIDKILYNEKNGFTEYILIDYKTGSIDTSLNDLIYGFKLQLPIYLYFILESHIFDRPIMAGIYYQQILKEEKEEDQGKELIELAKLEGYSTKDENILSDIDINYEKSKFVKGLKTIKDGSLRGNLLDSQQKESLMSLALQKIDEAYLAIKNNQFPIEPKKRGMEIDSCSICPFIDICSRKESSYVILEKAKGLPFMGEGGDESGMDEGTARSN